MGLFNLSSAVLIARAVTLLIAFTVHELAHAVTADYYGDDTPRRMGRISLNPLVHLDPIGTVMLLVAGFGWAKPVMVNPYNMRGNPRTMMAVVAVAGPVSNLLMASIVAIPFRLGLINFTFVSSNTILPSPDYLLSQFLWINIILAIFNLIPVPPLDGYKILIGLLPAEIGYRLRPLEQYGMLILMAIIFIPSFVPGMPDILGRIMTSASAFLLNIMIGPLF
jgi:Zn-dependent protease